MQGQGQAYNSFEQKKQKMIEDNYASVYHELLSNEGGPAPSKKPPIEIGNKDVYALSDIEGYNIDFLDFLNKLGLVEYQEKNPSNLTGWRQCLSLKKGQARGWAFPVYYKFNIDACRNFNDVIVLCGDYVRNDRNVSDGLVRILEELCVLLNDGKTEKNKGLYLLAGNHDIVDSHYDTERSQRELKKRVLQLSLYPQLLLKNAEGKELLFQHTNFPYLAKGNFIVNKKIDPQKASKFLDNSYTFFMANYQIPPMLGDDGFFYLRYIAKQGDLKPNYYGCNDKQYTEPLPRELYSDFGIGYDAKFIGHDHDFYGISLRPGGKGAVYNVHINNKNSQYVCFPCRANQEKSLHDKKNFYYVESNKEKLGKIYNSLYNLILCNGKKGSNISF